MKTNNIIRLFAIVTLVTAFAACKKTPSAPKITLTEVGHENSGKAEQGDDLHLEADILAEGLVKSIYVEIHQESGSYEIEKSFPAEAPLGEYHLHFTVTDNEGQTATAEAHVEVIENDGIDDDEEEHHHED